MVHKIIFSQYDVDRIISMLDPHISITPLSTLQLLTSMVVYKKNPLFLIVQSDLKRVCSKNVEEVEIVHVPLQMY